jgi:diphosphomevalonate decarboxylase
MEQCRKTSPYYDSWVASSQRDLEDATAYLQARNLSGLGAVMEHSCFKMHASMLCESSAAPRLMGRLRDVPGVVAVESLGVGPDPVVEVVQ